MNEMRWGDFEMPPAAAAKQTPFAKTIIVADAKASPFGGDSINSQEALSIHVLLDHLAQDQNIRQEAAWEIIETECGVRDILKIRRRDFQHVMELLTDLHFNDMQSKR